MTFDQLAEEIEAEKLSKEGAEKALDAIAFIQALHDTLKENGFTSNDEPDLAELENIIDAIHGELGAAVLFLCEPSFARVPDMMRAVAKQIPQLDGLSVPPVIVKGFERVAKRIENTRVNMQNLVKVSTAAKEIKG